MRLIIASHFADVLDCYKARRSATELRRTDRPFNVKNSHVVPAPSRSIWLGLRSVLQHRALPVGWIFQSRAQCTHRVLARKFSRRTSTPALIFEALILPATWRSQVSLSSWFPSLVVLASAVSVSLFLTGKQ